MENAEQIMDSFMAALSIVERTLAGREVPFEIVEAKYTEENGAHALTDIDGEKYYIAPTTNGAKLWIANFPIKNTDGTQVPPGYLGFPSDVAGAIANYYDTKPNGAFQRIGALGDLGTISLNELVREELQKVFSEDYDYAAAEREYTDKEYYRQGVEAEVSTALSFMQDMQGSLNKLKTQRELKTTNPEVDSHIQEAEKHINQAIATYLETLLPETKDVIIDRLGEVKIEK